MLISCAAIIYGVHPAGTCIAQGKAVPHVHGMRANAERNPRFAQTYHPRHAFGTCVI